MPNPIIAPNWHVILIHFPLGIFTLGMLMEITLGVLGYRGSARTASRWMIVLGALSSLPAAYAGLYAMSDIVHRTATPGLDPMASWRAVMNSSSLTNQQWEMLGRHVWSNAVAGGLAAVLAMVAIGCSDGWRRRLYPIFMLGMLFCLVSMAYGAWYGGDLVYRGSVVEKLPPRDVESASAMPSTAPSETMMQTAKHLDDYANPLQTHVVLAGVVAAFGLLGIGLSMRAAVTAPHWLDPELTRAGLSAMPNPQRGGREDLAMIRSFMPSVQVTGEVDERIPASRFWLLTFLLAVLVAVAGLWTIGEGHRTYKPADLWSMISGEGMIRRTAHFVVGVAIVVLPLFMALLARVARRSRAAAGLLGFLLVLALAAQVWLGVLLLFDQPHVSRDSGTWYKLKT